MTTPNRNAAIWYTADGYDPKSEGLNGRRMAGASFLRAFFRHGDVDEFVSYSRGPKAAAEFARFAEAAGAGKPCRAAYFSRLLELAPVGTIFFGAPNYFEEIWRRYSVGDRRHSVCGMVHTISTQTVMEGMWKLRSGPQQEWDGIICTSTAGKAALEQQMDEVDDMLRQRFGGLPPRPQMPVIPLGINCADFQRDEAAGAALRQQLGLGERDLLLVSLARLSPYDKFDPFPFFLALEAAQEQLGDDVKLNYLACGIYPDEHSRKVFEGGARGIMPNVRFIHHDGTRDEAPGEALSAADVFVFPIDNYQETFGLAPVEAMAAGLPVITSDWNGIKDTVTPDTGIRVPTRTLGSRHSMPEAWFYINNPSFTAEYASNSSATVEIDFKAMTDAIVALAHDRDLRARMGAAGRKRARAVFDWSVVIPQYQDFWGELAEIRNAAEGDLPDVLRNNPVSLPPTRHFASYPTEQLADGIGPCVALPAANPVAKVFALRRYNDMRMAPFEPQERIEQVFEQIRAAGPAGLSSRALADRIGINAMRVDRVFIWLLKYNFIARKPD